MDTDHSAKSCRSIQQNFAEQEKRTRSIELDPVRTPSTTKPPKAKTGKHKLHVFCGDLFCVDPEKHARFEKRLTAAGEDLKEHDLVAWYRARDAELLNGEELTRDHPALWLEKQFAESLKVDN